MRWWGWEFEYLGVFDQDAGRSIELADELAIPGDLGLFTNNFFFADEVSVRYTSQMNNAEINRVCCCCCSDGPCCGRSVEWIYGFRYLNLNEEFEYGVDGSCKKERRLTTFTPTIICLVSKSETAFANLAADGAWKALVRLAFSETPPSSTATRSSTFPALSVRPGTSGSSGNVAFVGDLNLTAIYQINSVWGARLGYNLIWIEGVALAPDQLDFTNTTTSGSGVSNRWRRLSARRKRGPRGSLVVIAWTNFATRPNWSHRHTGLSQLQCVNCGRAISAQLREDLIEGRASVRGNVSERCSTSL